MTDRTDDSLEFRDAQIIASLPRPPMPEPLGKMTVSTNDQTREKLAALALALGYIDPKRGGGSVSALLRAIADGEAVVERVAHGEQPAHGELLA